MFDRPSLDDAAIVTALRRGYGIDVAGLEFLGLGHDAAAWTFRARVADGTHRFVKLRRTVDEDRLRACRFLFEHGLPEIVAPLPALDGRYSAPVADLGLVVYPFVEATESVTSWLALEQWVAYGDIVGRLHRSALPDAIAAGLPHEKFRSRSLARVESVASLVDATPSAATTEADDDAPWRRVATTWRRHGVEIEGLFARATALASELRASAPVGSFVPCHGDIHTYNLLVTDDGNVLVIDWDELLLAPPERDLMFVLGSPMGPRRPEERAAFLSGYGPLTVDTSRLAYYHAEWALQDLVGYAQEARMAGASAASRNEAARIFESGFDPGGQVEVGLVHVGLRLAPVGSMAGGTSTAPAGRAPSRGRSAPRCG